MSIVCCKVTKDRIEIASDSICVRGITQDKGNNTKYSKLTKVNEMIVGSVGTLDENSLFQIFCQTHQPKNAVVDDILIFIAEFSAWKKGRIERYQIENSYIIIYQRKAFIIEGFLVQEIKDYMAIGAGMDYALTALYLGCDTEKAVHVACELCIYCELPIIKYFIEL